MKARLRFNKMGSMMYIGHLDLMRYFQKLFRRSGLDVSYSKGFNPHQIMSFASPLGIGLTSIGEYLDVSLESLNYNGFRKDIDGNTSYTVEEWSKIINDNSNGLINVTGFYIIPDDSKPSMSQLAAASYCIYFEDVSIPGRIYEYLDDADEIIYTKETKKSKRDIELISNIQAFDTSYESFAKKVSVIAEFDYDYEKKYMNEDAGCFYLMCTAGSSLNIKPEMIIDSFCRHNCIKMPDCQIMRIDMYTLSDRYISMSEC